MEWASKSNHSNHFSLFKLLRSLSIVCMLCMRDVWRVSVKLYLYLFNSSQLRDQQNNTMMMMRNKPKTELDDEILRLFDFEIWSVIIIFLSFSVCLTPKRGELLRRLIFGLLFDHKHEHWTWLVELEKWDGCSALHLIRAQISAHSRGCLAAE